MEVTISPGLRYSKDHLQYSREHMCCCGVLGNCEFQQLRWHLRGSAPFPSNRSQAGSVYRFYIFNKDACLSLFRMQASLSWTLVL